MQGRKFIQTTAFGTGLACLSPFEVFARINEELYPKLIISTIFFKTVISYLIA